MRFATSTIVALVALFVSGASAGTACHSDHGAWGADCETLFSQYENDQSTHASDGNGRASIQYSSCASVVHFQNNVDSITGAQLVSTGRAMYESCFGDNADQYKSGVLTGIDSNKYCLCNDGSQGSC
ncbi:hypothetical protein NEOLEDRAFT_445222 [Neolentinus lepideus HHB14362 ss-1]|uniref:Uncharacterized protein n=1 Tax=Neolentinus lepideus HHB14362 ss-1 TaxID=1314782 RepID=A0A165RRX7_9AGAM|nr:hypothetical protein NEOLEDRAFT_445222 [Neolentinus lepideus HHB14362 ss-1]